MHARFEEDLIEVVDEQKKDSQESTADILKRWTDYKPMPRRFDADVLMADEVKLQEFIDQIRQLEHGLEDEINTWHPLKFFKPVNIKIHGKDLKRVALGYLCDAGTLAELRQRAEEVMKVANTQAELSYVTAGWISQRTKQLLDAIIQDETDEVYLTNINPTIRSGSGL